MTGLVVVSNKLDAVLVCMSMSNIPFKLCAHCLQQKPLTEFDKQPQNRDGVSGHRKDCRNIYRRSYWRSHYERRRVAHDPVPAGYKWCPVCQTAKPVTEFWGRTDRLQSRCASCNRIYLQRRSDEARKGFSFNVRIE